MWDIAHDGTHGLCGLRFEYLFRFSRPRPRGLAFLAVMTLSGPVGMPSDQLERLTPRNEPGDRFGIP